MNVTEIMTPYEELICVTPHTTLREAAEAMKEADAGIIPVVSPSDRAQLVGVITDRDIVVRAVAKGVDENTAKVEEYMSKNVMWVAPDSDTGDVADIMAGTQVHRVPVLENGLLQGMVSLADIATTKKRDAEKALEGISEGAKAEGRTH